MVWCPAGGGTIRSQFGATREEVVALMKAELRRLGRDLGHFEWKDGGYLT